MIVIKADASVRLDYLRPPRDTAEKYHRAHTENVLDRIAFRYFDSIEMQEALRNHINTELLLEGLSLPESITIRGKNQL